MPSAVVQIHDGGDRVHAQAVDVELLEPEQRTCDQKVRDFDTVEIVRVRAPLGVKAFAPVHVLVEMRAVEVDQAVRVGRKWPGTQSKMTPIPSACARSTNARKSSGEPWRLVGAYIPVV